VLLSKSSTDRRPNGASFSAFPEAVFTILARVCPLAVSMTGTVSPFFSWRVHPVPGRSPERTAANEPGFFLAVAEVLSLYRHGLLVLGARREGCVGRGL
jgi:hypothetical protein